MKNLVFITVLLIISTVVYAGGGQYEYEQALSIEQSNMKQAIPLYIKASMQNHASAIMDTLLIMVNLCPILK